MMQGIINPFSDNFLETWNEWKEYRWEQHKFKYKGCRSEQAALMHINNISGRNEEVAVKIILQSMAEGWKGLFELKNSKNGTSKERFTKEGVSEEFNSRTYPKNGY